MAMAIPTVRVLRLQAVIDILDKSQPVLKILEPAVCLIGAILSIFSLWLFVSLASVNIRRCLWIICAASIFITSMVVPFGFVVYYQAQQQPFMDLLEYSAGTNLAIFLRDSLAGVYYHKKKIYFIFSDTDIPKFLQLPGKSHLIIVTKELKQYLPLWAPKSRLVMVRGKYYLYSLD
jgi:hypothetical protein